jgi:hypothetical protein
MVQAVSDLNGKKQGGQCSASKVSTIDRDLY